MTRPTNNRVLICYGQALANRISRIAGVNYKMYRFLVQPTIPLQVTHKHLGYAQHHSALERFEII